MKWYLKCLNQYFDFKGRARRKEYWMFFLFNTIFAVAFSLLDSLMPFCSLFFVGYAIVLLIPSVAVAVRRLHDIGKNGWCILAIFVPSVVGQTVFMYLWSLWLEHCLFYLFFCRLINYYYLLHLIVIGCIIGLIGLILMLVWFCKDSKYDSNKWGQCPKQRDV